MVGHMLNSLNMNDYSSAQSTFAQVCFEIPNAVNWGWFDYILFIFSAAETDTVLKILKSNVLMF